MKLRCVAFGSSRYRDCLELRRRVLREPLGLEWSARDLEGEEDQRHFALVDGKDLVACLVIRPLEDARVKLRQMAVLPERQGRGLGRELVSATIKLLHHDGVEEVELHARNGAVGFYEKLGFVRVGKRFLEVDIPHWRMVRGILDLGIREMDHRIGAMEHHVYFWLKDERKNEADVAVYEAGMEKLCQSPVIAGGGWGKPAPTTPRAVTDHSWDYGLSLRFAAMEDHDRYQNTDPHHTEFVESFKDWWDRVEVRDLGLDC